MDVKDSSGKFLKGNTPHNKGKRKEVDIEYCKKKYLEGYSCLDISKKFNINEKTIWNRFKENNIPTSKKHSDRTKQKIKQSMSRHNFKKGNTFGFKKGQIPWNKEKELYYTVWNKGKVTGLKSWKNRKFTKETIKKIKQSRAKQILPLKDTSIEIKIQNLLSQLHIEYFTHKYMSEINHSYQCDIFIPEQNGIGQKTIIECDGCFFHSCPICKIKEYEGTTKRKELDKIRTKELIGQGFRVIRLWEHEIKSMELKQFQGILNEQK